MNKKRRWLCLGICGFLMSSLCFMPEVQSTNEVVIQAEAKEQTREEKAEVKVKALMSKFGVQKAKSKKDKLDLIVQAVASLNYDYAHSSWVSMIENGGGDCWA